LGNTFIVIVLNIKGYLAVNKERLIMIIMMTDIDLIISLLINVFTFTVFYIDVIVFNIVFDIFGLIFLCSYSKKFP